MSPAWRPNHKRLSSSGYPINADFAAATWPSDYDTKTDNMNYARQNTHSFPSRPRTRRTAWWRRMLRSCISSSNPDPDAPAYCDFPEPYSDHHGGAEADDTDCAAGQTGLTLVDIKGKSLKRASYVPRHAETAFAKTTTPLKAKDEVRAKRTTQLYQGILGTIEEGEGAAKARGKVEGATSPATPVKAPPPVVGLSFVTE